MKFRVPTTRVTIFIVVALALFSTPAVAWALTSPKTTVKFPAESAEVHGRLQVGGTANHQVGVAGIRLVLRNLDDNTYFDGKTWQDSFIRFDIPVHSPGETKTRWSYSLSASKLKPGNYRARAFAYSVEGNGDGFGGDWNEFTYLGRFNPALYDTEISSPSDGQTISGPISVTGVAHSTEGVKSVRVVVRNTETNHYWNSTSAGWQSTFVTVQAELTEPGGTSTNWTVDIPADQVAPGTYFTRAWVRTAEGHGDPIGRGQSAFTVNAAEAPMVVQPKAEPDPIAVDPSVTVGEPVPDPTTTEPTATTAKPTTKPKATPATIGSTTTTAKPTTKPKATPATIKPTTTTAKPTTIKPTTTTAKPTTSAPSTSAKRQPFGQGNVSWELVASDDFNGNKLDDNMWEYGWFRSASNSKYDRPVSGGETACYHTDQVTLAGGELNLTMRPTTAEENASGVCRKRDGSKAYFVSGYATTYKRYQIQPGTYVETRMLMPGQGNVLYNWPAFWSTDMDKAFGSRWPHSGEFDIAEILKGQPCANFHYATSAGGPHLQTGKRCSTVAANKWAVFGMKWNYDGTVEMFHQGQRVQDRGDKGIWNLDPVELAGSFATDYSHNIALQHGLHDPAHVGYKEPTAANPLTVKFDYVDVYKLPR